MRRVWPLLLGLLLAGATPTRVYRNEALRIRRLAAPEGWELAPPSPYPRLVAVFVRESGARITASVDRVRAGRTPIELATEARAGLARQGFSDLVVRADGPRAVLDGTLDSGRRVARQVYLVAGPFAYVLTLVAPLEEAASGRSDLDEVVRSLEFTDESP